MAFLVGGQTLGVLCAQKRKLLDIGPILTHVESEGIEIHRGKYETPFGQVVGLRNGSLLCERCFRWIGDNWWQDGNRLCFLVRRLSDDQVRQIWVVSISVRDPKQYELVPIDIYQSADRVDSSILLIIREATRMISASTSCL